MLRRRRRGRPGKPPAVKKKISRIPPSMFKVGDVVWAKIDGFPPWPAMVVFPPSYMPKPPNPRMKKNAIYRCVAFFGTREYSWSHNLVHYQLMSIKDIGAKSKGLIKACRDANKYIATKDERLIVPQYVEDEQVDDEPSSNDRPSPDDGEVVWCFPRNDNYDDDDEFNVREDPSSSTETNSIWGIELEADIPNEKPANPHSGNDNHDVEDVELPIVIEQPTNTSTPIVNLNTPPKAACFKELNTVDITIGFIGIGTMGSGIVKNLLYAKYKVIIWNRTYEKAARFIEAGATVAEKPEILTENADITFVCLANEAAVKDVFTRIITQIEKGKAYVQMSTINPKLSIEIKKAIELRGGRYMECFMQGGQSAAENGELTLLCGGNGQLYSELKPVLDAISTRHVNLSSNIGSAHITTCSLMTLTAARNASLVELVRDAVCDDISQETAYSIFEAAMPSFIVNDKKSNLLSNNHINNHTIKHYQKAIKDLINTAPTDIILNAIQSLRDQYKTAMLLNLGDADISSLRNIEILNDSLINGYQKS